MTTRAQGAAVRGPLPLAVALGLASLWLAFRAATPPTSASHPSAAWVPSAARRAESDPRLPGMPRARPALQGLEPQAPSGPPPAAVAGPGADDPWLEPEEATEERPVQPALPAPAPPSVSVRAKRVQVDDTGALQMGREQERWQVPACADGFLLVSYDLSTVAPEGAPVPPEALRGLGLREDLPPAGLEPWWWSLVERVVVAVGPTAWREPSAWLGWDAWERALVVRQTPEALERIGRLLEEVARARAGSLGLRLEGASHGTGPGALELRVDVPWGRGVRVHRGRSDPYLQDWDIECGNSTAITPILAPADSGLALAAWRDEGVNGDDGLYVEVAHVASPARIHAFEGVLPSDGSPGSIDWWGLNGLEFVEAPTSAGVWRGRLSAAPGAHPITLGDGRRFVLRVEGERVPSAPPRPLRRLELHGPREAPARHSEAANAGLRASWRATGGGPRLEADLQPTGTCCQALLAEARLGWVCLGAPAFPVTDEFDLPAVGGGVRVTADVHELADGSAAVDLTVVLGRATSEGRRIQAEAQLYGASEVQRAELHLPTCRVETCVRRVEVPPGGAATVRLHVDLGSGVEAYDLTLARRP